MTAFSAISQGIRNASHVKRMIVVLWIFLILMGAVATTPIAAVISRSLGHSLWAHDLLRGLDPSWITEVFHDSRGYPGEAVPVTLGLSLLIALLGHLLAAGGALSVFAAEDRRYTAARFFEGCGRYFWRFFRLMLLSLVLIGIVMAINSGLKAIEEKLWGEGMVETPIFYSTRVRLAFLFFLLVVVGMVTDFAKIRLVVEPGRSAIRAFFWSIRFVVRNFGRCFRIWLSLILAGVALYLLYDRIAAWLPQTTMAGVLLLLTAQQAYILSRLWLRMTFWASETEFYYGLKPQEQAPIEPVSVYTWPPAPAGDLTAEAPAPVPNTDEEAAGPA